jgi:hypothetical protein
LELELLELWFELDVFDDLLLLLLLLPFDLLLLLDEEDCDWLFEPDGLEADCTLASGATMIASAAMIATTRWPERR